MHESENSPTNYSVFAYWYLGSNCHLVHGSFSGIPEDLHVEHIQSTLSMALLQDRGFLIQDKRSIL